MDGEKNRVESITKILSGELFKAFGLKKDGSIAKIFSPLVRKPIHHFAEICVGFDQRVVNLGFQAAAKWIMPNFAPGIHATSLSAIPPVGPLLIASNHPGAYDSLVIASQIPRDDLKIIVNIPLDFISEIPATLSHFFYAPNDAFIRMNVVRSAIHHLQSGGALLLFASGRIDPDPSTMGGAEKELERWSRSIEIMLRRVPETRLLITIVSNILHPRYVNHLFTRFQKERPDKQRISEFFQVMKQMLSPGAIQLFPKLTISKPYTLDELSHPGLKINLMGAIQAEAKQLLNIHMD